MSGGGLCMRKGAMSGGGALCVRGCVWGGGGLCHLQPHSYPSLPLIPKPSHPPPQLLTQDIYTVISCVILCYPGTNSCTNIHRAERVNKIR